MRTVKKETAQFEIVLKQKELSHFDRFSYRSFSEIQQLREHSFDQLIRG